MRERRREIREGEERLRWRGYEKGKKRGRRKIKMRERRRERREGEERLR